MGIVLIVFTAHFVPTTPSHTLIVSAMPAVISGKVLVTGANGYIAVWLVQKLLEQGYSVRGTIRSASRAKHLNNLFSKYGDKFELLIIEDITKVRLLSTCLELNIDMVSMGQDGAFDEAVKGVDAIEHTASPFHFDAVEPSEIIGPAVAGTKSILESARKFGTNVKRVVVTSSVAAILNTLPNPTVFTEEDWNTTAVEDCEKNGKNASPFSKYRASKTLAERAAWDFVEKHKGSLPWDLVVINPPFVFGPFLHEVTGAGSLNQSLSDWYKTIIKADKDDKTLVAGGYANLLHLMIMY